MNLLDPFLLLFCIVNAGIGYRIGIAKSLGYLGSFGVAFAVSRLLMPPLFGFIGGIFGENLDIGKAILFVLLFTLSSLAIQLAVKALDRRAFEDKTLMEKIISAILFSITSLLFLGLLLVFAEAYVTLCLATSQCMSGIEWLHTNIESALLAPTLIALLSGVLKFFI